MRMWQNPISRRYSNFKNSGKLSLLRATCGGCGGRSGVQTEGRGDGCVTWCHVSPRECGW
jgi:hypothetical protein